jgi:stage II sporulation protein AB (anti-sigma F factor)
MALRKRILKSFAKLEDMKHLRESAKKFLESSTLTDEARMEVLFSLEEAVTNSVMHGYGGEGGEILVRLADDGARVSVEVDDEGHGFVYDKEAAMRRLDDPRCLEAGSGRGLIFIETFMDELAIDTGPGEGTRVRMTKIIRS